MAAYEITIEGLERLAEINSLDEDATTKARQAVNKATDRARARSAKAIAEQVAFPSGYLAPSKGRLTVSKKASNSDLEGRVRGQSRPTMLARFMKGPAPQRGQSGVTVEVDHGRAVFMPKAFTIKLKGASETQHNLGIAVRLKPGETLRNKAKKIRNSRGLYVLYGPSVDQAFRLVAQDESPDTAEFLEKEFSRLMKLDK
jgi:hypothetical protein